MNKKTITKLLTRKHEDFLKSIKDDHVREMIDKHSIITGGAIASMLLNEKVNDYDYYFKTKEACFAVANYYVDQFAKNNPDCEIKPEVLVEDNRVKIKIQSAGITGESERGGYQYFESQPLEDGEKYVDNVTKIIEEADDINSEDLEKIHKDVASVAKDPYRTIFMTSNAITLSNKVQLIIRFYGGSEEIHKNYDFVHCKNYWDSATRKLWLNQPALESLLAKHLFYMGSLYPVCSIIRTRKFIKKGWHINAGQYIKMCFQVSELDLTDIRVLEEQLTGVDNAYFYQVIEYCKARQRKDKDFEINLPYLVSIIDRIF